MLSGSMEEVEQETSRVPEATRGFKHMVDASDYMFCDIPFENIKTAVQTVKSH